jgi:hypothetical protein
LASAFLQAISDGLAQNFSGIPGVDVNYGREVFVVGIMNSEFSFRLLSL